MLPLQTLGRVRLQGERSDEDAGPPSAQPKRLVLLAYLALASVRGPVRRDVLPPFFGRTWEMKKPEGRCDRRHYPRAVGDDVLVGAGEEFPVSAERFRCDAVEFERLVAAGEPRRPFPYMKVISSRDFMSLLDRPLNWRSGLTARGPGCGAMPRPPRGRRPESRSRQASQSRHSLLDAAAASWTRKADGGG